MYVWTKFRFQDGAQDQNESDYRGRVMVGWGFGVSWDLGCELVKV